jgi:NAD(P)-dependent dehydrogenase (short-subunit alcohol dehydrogenase family)
LQPFFPAGRIIHGIGAEAPGGVHLGKIGLRESGSASIAADAGNDLRSVVEAPAPLGRVGQVDDIASAVAFFASDDAKWVTGETIYTAGGYS